MYDANKHEAFSARMKNWVNNLQNAKEEANRVKDIYTNETASGADAAFVSNDNATKQEHIDGIVLMERILNALAMDGETTDITSQDQTSNVAPWIQ